MEDNVIIRNASLGDIETICGLNGSGADQFRMAYWQDIFDHYVLSGRADRLCLVAEKGSQMVGVIVGEIRAWEFGSLPCGWVFVLSVAPGVRELGIGQRLFTEMCNRLKEIGATTVRTMVDLDNKLALSFFRSVGMTTGRYVELEKQLD